MFSELGIEPSAFAVAQHYGSIIDSLIIDKSDEGMVNKIKNLGISVYATDIVMRDQKDRGRLAAEIIDRIKNRAR
jgi:LPPG:FO 2-phospho-L-lactate transferase